VFPAGGVLIALAIGGASLAQETPASPPPADGEAVQADQTITVDVEYVNVALTVSDEDDHLVTNLPRDDFRVFEDDVEQEILGFDAETELPLTLALIIDVSGSIRERLEFEQEAAIEFFYTTIEEGRDQGMLVTFDSAVDVLQEFTDNPEQLSEGVRRIRAGGGTALYDAIFLSISQRITQQQGEGRRVVVAISDGDDNSSRVSLTETLELAQRNDVVVYTISTNSTTNFAGPEQQRGDRTLQTFAEGTGGRAFFPTRLEDLAVNFADISEDLRSQYSLGYEPTNLEQDGSWRRIRIETSDEDLRVQHRPGYYAPRVE
jgi:VWFA-related protein